MRLTINFQKLLLSCIAVSVGGCWSDFEYEYISLEDSMEVLDYGKTELSNIRAHVDMPVLYALEREKYILYGEVDKRSIPPAIIFSIENKTLIDPYIKGATLTKCFGGFQSIRQMESKRYGYPELGIRYIWQQNAAIFCPNEIVREPGAVLVDVYSSDGTLVVTEEIRYTIKINGIHREYDGI